MRNKIIITSALLFVFAVPMVSAQTYSTSDSAKPHLITENVMMRKDERQDFQKLLQAKREEFKDQMEAERKKFKLKLGELKNKRKKTGVERIDLKLSDINQNATEHLSLAIEKMEKLLDKFKERAAKAKTEGQNTSEVDSAITAAEAAIKSAKEAVATQAAKVYTAKIEDEPTLKNTMGATISQLRHDLKLTHDIVKDAKQKVMDVARALAKLHSESPITNHTTLPTHSPTIAPSIVPTAIPNK